MDLSTKNRFTADASEAAFYEDIFPLGKHKQGTGQPTMLNSVPTKNESGMQIFLLDDSSETLQNLKKEDTRTDLECQSKQEAQDQNVTGSIPVVPLSLLQIRQLFQAHLNT